MLIQKPYFSLLNIPGGKPFDFCNTIKGEIKGKVGLRRRMGEADILLTTMYYYVQLYPAYNIKQNAMKLYSHVNSTE